MHCNNWYSNGIFWFYLIAVILVAIGSGAFNSTEYFNEIEKPVHTPPAIIFGIVWAILFILLIAAAYMTDVSSRDAYFKTVFRAVFIFNLLFVILWMAAFFGMNDTLSALVINILLVVSIVILMLMAGRVSPTAMYLLAPYLIWTIFAFVLTLNIYDLNEKDLDYLVI